jgi:hypothetical protein
MASITATGIVSDEVIALLGRDWESGEIGALDQSLQNALGHLHE